MLYKGKEVVGEPSKVTAMSWQNPPLFSHLLFGTEGLGRAPGWEGDPWPGGNSWDQGCVAFGTLSKSVWGLEEKLTIFECH